MRQWRAFGRLVEALSDACRPADSDKEQVEAVADGSSSDVADVDDYDAAQGDACGKAEAIASQGSRRPSTAL
jgi:hypothetical protein